MENKTVPANLWLSHVKPKLFVFLIIGFTLTVFIGLQTHILGHYIVAKIIDNKSSLYWGGYGIPCDSKNRNFRKLCYDKYSYEIENNLDFPYKNVFDYINLQSEEKWKWVKFGGQAITMIIGSIGFAFLLYYRKKIVNPKSRKQHAFTKI